MTTTTGRIDGAAFGSCTVGGLDSTDAIVGIWRTIDREDVRVLIVSGIAPAWFNLVELDRLAASVPVPVLALSFEASDGLETAIREHFDGQEAARRLERYRALPPRQRVRVDGEQIFVREAHPTDVDLGTILEAFTIDGRRPEPVRTARLLARAADRWDRSG